jgi:response regulator RpfG family c-di-GMP phosphodiesterase
MPHMNGFQMVYEMQRIDGECEVLFLTGQVDMYEELSKLFDKMNVREVIRKPLAIKQLVDKINSLESLPASSRTTNSGRSVELVFAKTQRKEGANHLSQEPPRKELLDLILKTVSRGKATLGNIAQQMRPRIDFKWDEFIGAVNYLVSKGQLQSKGDGFEVLYSITEEGEKDIR